MIEHGLDGDVVRRLTPLECARLQGFSDEWLVGVSDSVAYRMLGNSVAVVCSTWIGRRLARAADATLSGR